MATILRCLAHLVGFKDDSNIVTNSQEEPVRLKRKKNGEI